MAMFAFSGLELGHPLPVDVRNRRVLLPHSLQVCTCCEKLMHDLLVTGLDRGAQGAPLVPHGASVHGRALVQQHLHKLLLPGLRRIHQRRPAATWLHALDLRAELQQHRRCGHLPPLHRDQQRRPSARPRRLEDLRDRHTLLRSLREGGLLDALPRHRRQARQGLRPQNLHQCGLFGGLGMLRRGCLRLLRGRGLRFDHPAILIVVRPSRLPPVVVDAARALHHSLAGRGHAVPVVERCKGAGGLEEVIGRLGLNGDLASGRRVIQQH
mmetsp:Transcript_130955/g.378885  ORF Transcript_130955/g.378885 Transcript_130955/m.378885 type:complete len:268 (-) Transcript_130955:261-1064(-)